jgi:hypothetical protein
MRRHAELKLFLAAYVLYNAGRWVTAGDFGVAVDNARWIVRLEDTLGVGVERSVQSALDGGPMMALLSHVSAAFPVAPPRLAGIGMADSVSVHGAVSLTGRSSVFVDRAADPSELVAAVRGERALPEPRLAAQRSAAERLDGRDRAILAMRLAGTAPGDIAATVGLTRSQLSRHLGRIVALLRGAAPAAAA